MLWELALLSVLVPCSYWGLLFVRRQPFGSATYGWMLLAVASLAVVALASGDGPAWVDALGAVALGAGACLLVVAPALRAAARWAVATDRLRLAGVLVDIRDVLQPGTGGREEKKTIATLREVHAGRVDEAVGALRAVRERAPPAVRAGLDERIVLLYLSAQRWDDAVSWAEAHLLAGEQGPAEAAEAPDGPEAEDGPRTYRHVGRELGMSPPLWIELVGAYLRRGDLDRAADHAERFERAARGVSELALVVHRLRLVFLAHTGRVEAVDRLLEPALAGHLSTAARSYWAGVARHAAGDVAGARAAFETARARSPRDGRARALVDRSLAEIDRPAPATPARAAALADRLARAELTLPPRIPSRLVGVTAVLVGLNLAVAALCALLVGPAGDLGTIVRAGANLRWSVEGGQLWRLASSVFVHVGWVHLVVNALGLWSLGRLAEGLFGRTRMLVIYGVAGLVGAIASHLMSRAGVSAGASGAMFGLLGATLVELALHHQSYRREWRRSLLGALAVVTAAQIAIGVFYEVIDQSAHVGGLVGGAVVGLALSPSWRWAEHAAVRWLARGLAGVLVVAYVAGGVMAVRTGYADELAAQPRATRALGPFVVDVPAPWVAGGDELVDREIYVVLSLVADAPGAAVERLGPWVHTERGRAKERGFDGVEDATALIVPVPDGWASTEWIAVGTDPLGSTQRYRVIAFTGQVGDLPLVGALYVPDVLARDAGAAAALGAVLATIRPAP